MCPHTHTPRYIATHPPTPPKKPTHPRNPLAHPTTHPQNRTPKPMYLPKCNHPHTPTPTHPKQHPRTHPLARPTSTAHPPPLIPPCRPCSLPSCRLTQPPIRALLSATHPHTAQYSEYLGSGAEWGASGDTGQRERQVSDRNAATSGPEAHWVRDVTRHWVRWARDARTNAFNVSRNNPGATQEA